MQSLRGIVIPALAALVGGAALVVWAATSPPVALRERVPGLDRPATTVTAAAPAAGAARLIPGPGKPAADLPGAWPGFRGAGRDNLVTGAGPLARVFPPGGPKVLWSVEVGEGHAGPAVQDGRVYLLDYDRAASADALRCLSLADGQEIWRYSYPVPLKRNHGLSRTVPAVAAGRVVALGPKCQVTCADAATGEHRWSIDLVRDYGTTVPQWYAGQCPLIDGDRVILAPAGKEALLAAVDLASGKVIWKTPNSRGWEMTHSSVMVQDLVGRKTYVYCGSGGVVGVDAATGQVLWESPEWTISIATVPSPVCLPDGRVLLTGGYNAGAMMLQVKEAGGKFQVETLFRLKARQFGSTQHTPVLYQDHYYGVREDKELVCVDQKGQVAWRSGSANRYGLGPWLVADGLIYVLSDEGELTLAEASPAGFKPLGKAKVLEGPDAWGPMALVGGRLLVRDMTRLACVDVRQP